MLRIYGTTGKSGAATVTEFRYGPKMLSYISYETMGYISAGSSLWGDDEITVDEILRYFTRPNAVYVSNGAAQKVTNGVNARPRMSSDELVFWYPGEGVYWNRPYNDYIPTAGNMRSYAAQDNSSKSVSLKFRIYKEKSEDSDIPVKAYFDNALLKVSGIMWEFSPDGGNKWYQLYDLPNKPYMRISLPALTGQLRVRASSCSDDEWLGGYSIEPRPDYHPKALSTATLTIPYSDAYGYVRWELDNRPEGNIIYRVISDSGTYYTRDTMMRVPTGWSFFDITAYGQSGFIIAQTKLVGAGQYAPQHPQADVYLYDDSTEYIVITYTPATIPTGVTGFTCNLWGKHTQVSEYTQLGTTVAFDNSGSISFGTTSSLLSWGYNKDDDYKFRVIYNGKYAEHSCNIVYHNYTSGRYSGDFKSGQTRYSWLEEGHE